jgi:integrase
VELPPLKTSVKRSVYIRQLTHDKLKANPGKLHPDVSDDGVLQMRLSRMFAKYLPEFDARGPIRTHNFRASKATHLVQ